MNAYVKDALAATAAAAAAMATTYWFGVRPLINRWGATDDEVARELPGDDLLIDPAMNITRAVTIDATPEEIWPWLLQIGQGRGGFYSYDWLENLMGLDIHTLDYVEPEFQNLQVDDFIPFAPYEQVGMMVARMEPNRALVLLAPERDFAAPLRSQIDQDELDLETTWAFVLEPVDAGRTRLVVRFRLRHAPSMAASFLREAVLGPAHFIMERKMMLGIKQRVEATRTTDELANYRQAHVA